MYIVINTPPLFGAPVEDDPIGISTKFWQQKTRLPVVLSVLKFSRFGTVSACDGRTHDDSVGLYRTVKTAVSRLLQMLLV